MTAKRFKIVSIEEELYPMPIYYDNDRDKELTYDKVCDLLNTQHEQIQHLELRIKDYDVALKSLQDLTDRKLKENEQLKQVLGSILIEVRREISATNRSGEVKAFVNPNSFDLISNVLKKYGALKDWYE